MIMTGIKKTVSFCIAVIFHIKQIRHISHLRRLYLFGQYAFFSRFKRRLKSWTIIYKYALEKNQYLLLFSANAVLVWNVIIVGFYKGFGVFYWTVGIPIFNKGPRLSIVKLKYVCFLFAFFRFLNVFFFFQFWKIDLFLPFVSLSDVSTKHNFFKFFPGKMLRVINRQYSHKISKGGGIIVPN